MNLYNINYEVYNMYYYGTILYLKKENKKNIYNNTLKLYNV